MMHSTETNRCRYRNFTPFDDESVICVQHTHWKNRIGYVLIILFCSILLLQKVTYPHFSFIGFVWDKPVGEKAHDIIYYITTAFLVYFVLKSAANFIRSISIVYYVTDQRIVIVSGVINVLTSEMLLNKCENVVLSQNFIERLVKSGDIQITGAGSAIALNDVHKARELKDLISRLLHDMEEKKERNSKDKTPNPIYDLEL